jgi:DNA invertase Pin-like site-specific DNA recombinase
MKRRTVMTEQSLTQGSPRLKPRRAGLYCRVSTTDQTCENQLLALRSFAAARGWGVTEFVDSGVSGAKEKRPALDAMLAAVRARKVDVVACVKLDRLARSTHHLLTLGKELEALGVDLVALDQAIDTTTPAGRLMFIVLAAIAEFERDLIRDRVQAGLRRARAQGKRLGRPRVHQVNLHEAQALRAKGISLRGIARALGVHPMSVRRALAGTVSVAPGGRAVSA